MKTKNVIATIVTVAFVAANLFLVNQPGKQTFRGDIPSGISTSQPPNRLVAAAFTNILPVGQAGSWEMLFEDNFDGSALDLTKWAANWFNEGGNMNKVGTYAKNVSVSNGVLTLTLESSSRGALINTQSNNGFEVLPGMYAEARIMFPGNGSKLYNWPAWWISGYGWPNPGEHDIAEVLGGSLTVNYHSPSGAHNQGSVSGYWGDQFHVYAIYRKAKTAEVYWDGKLVKSYSTDDNGKGEDLILNVGAGSPAMYGSTGAMQVDYVRVWKPGTGIPPTVGTPVTVTITSTRTPTTTRTPTATPTGTRTPIPPTPTFTALPVTPVGACYPVHVGDELIGNFCP